MAAHLNFSFFLFSGELSLRSLSPATTISYQARYHKFDEFIGIFTLKQFDKKG